jgi:hypothetical protein
VSALPEKRIRLTPAPHDDDERCFRWIYNAPMKRRRETNRTEPSAATVARLAGVSISRVYRLRQEGRSDAQIIADAQRRREFVLRDVPPLPVDVVTNGHAGGAVLSFSAAQAAEKSWSAKLKQVEYQERCGELVPLSYVRHWGTTFLVAARDEMLKAPSELADTLASESDPRVVERTLQTWVERVMLKFYECEKLWSPPPSPPGMAA